MAAPLRNTHVIADAEFSAARRYVAERIGSVEPRTTDEYFVILLARAIRAAKGGNYGIAAALAVTSGRGEIVTFGVNSIFQTGDPHGHAESNAVKRMFQLYRGSRNRLDRLPSWTSAAGIAGSTVTAFRRSSEEGLPRETVLYSTLEPCPMCTVALINAGVNRVVIAQADSPAGSLGPEGRATLPPIWLKLMRAQNMRVEFVEPGSHGGTWISQELADHLRAVFLATRESLDQSLGQGGFLGHFVEDVRPTEG